MPAVIKKPRTSLRFVDGTPARVLKEARTRYKNYVVEEKIEDDDDELEDFFETDFAKEMEAKMTPGLYLSNLREVHNWSQAELAAKVGGVSAKRISDWENGRREISKDYAKKLGKVLNFPADKFI